MSLINNVAPELSESHVYTLGTSTTPIQELGLEHVIEEERFPDALLPDLCYNEQPDVLASSLSLQLRNIVFKERRELHVVDPNVFAINQLE